jgi:gamma-polyglutamate biosynthesis protein CapA
LLYTLYMIRNILIFSSALIILSGIFVIYQNNTFYSKDDKKVLRSIEPIVSATSSSQLSVLFVGDIMADRYIRKVMQTYPDTATFVNSFLPGISENNAKYDYVVANLEGPITDNESKSLLKNGGYSKELTFTFSTETTKILQMLNVQVVSLANNHTDNFGAKGFASTMQFLDVADIEHFGNPYNNNKNEIFLSKKVCKQDICISYIGYHQFTGNNEAEIISTEIQKQKSDSTIDFVVVMPHWGEEYQIKQNEFQIKTARDFVDAGADLVVGAHPHVIQGNEIYKDKNIYYSLGNYIFDQWFSPDVRSGLGLEITFLKKDIEGKVVKEITVAGTKTVQIDKTKIVYK